MIRSIRYLSFSFLKSTNRKWYSAATRTATSSSTQASVGKTPYTRVSQLKNGLRVATENNDLPTATVGVWIDTGSRYETESNNGVAHFLEHMAFKGTQRRSQQDIELEVENMGGQLNAYTSREQTAYFAKVLSKDIPKAVDILSDILQNSRLEPAAISREREVILREQEEVGKNMDEVIFDHLHAVAYQGTALGRTILGPSENIKRINQRDLTEYIRKNYAAGRMVLVGAGGVDHDAIVKMAENAFGSLPAKTAIMEPEPAYFTGSEVRCRDDKMETAHIAIAHQGASWTNPDYWPLLVAQNIVGNWNRSMTNGYYLSSKLAQQVSQQHLAHSFMSFNTAYKDTGLWGIYLVSDKKYELDDLVYLVQQEWVRLCLNVTDGEVERAKAQIKAALMLGLDGTTAVAEDIARQLLTSGNRLSLTDMHELLDHVDAATVKKVASDYIYDRCPAVAAFGPIESVPDYNRIRASTMWLRN